MQLKVFLKTFPETSRCPSCGNIGRIRRSRARNILESLLKASGFFNIYKCRDCGWRGTVKRYTMNRTSIVTLGMYIALVLAGAYIITTILKRNFGT